VPAGVQISGRARARAVADRVRNGAERRPTACWCLVYPADPGKVAALARAPPPRTVVWLDGLWRYLDGEHGLTGGVMRALLNAPNPVVISGTPWPDQYTACTAVAARGSADPRAGTRTAGPDCSRPHRPRVRPGGAGPGPRRCGSRSAVADCPACDRLSTASSARRRASGLRPGTGHDLQQAGAAGAVSNPARRDSPPQASASRTSASPARSLSSLPSSPRPRRRAPASYLHSADRTNANPAQRPALATQAPDTSDIADVRKFLLIVIMSSSRDQCASP